MRRECMPPDEAGRAEAFFEPFEGDFDARRARHLLRRSGFGGSVSDVERAVSSGLGHAVEACLNVSPKDAGVADLDSIRHVIRRRDEVDDLAGWWLLRMVRAEHPLREKLALFMHGHFATSFDKVQNVELMLEQYETFVENLEAPFEQMLLAMAKDPAMLIWLDSNSNEKSHPNENFARELMELFSLGVGNYTEKDIQEAARAFTGWHERRGEFYFNRRQHDDGIKVVFGKRDAWNGEDIISLCAQKDAAARFLGLKLLKFFVHPEPPDALVDSVASRLRQGELRILPVLGELFRSQGFYSTWTYRAQIKSPTEFLVGAARLLGASFDAREMSRRLRAMGQSLFRPPTVKGWDGHRKWISSATWLAREGAIRDLLLTHEIDPRFLFEGMKGRDALQRLLEQLVDDDLPQDAKRRLLEQADELGDDASNWRAMVQVMTMLPEYQVG